MTRAKVRTIKLTTEQEAVVIHFATANGVKFSAALKLLIREGAKLHGYEFPQDENTHGGKRR